MGRKPRYQLPHYDRVHPSARVGLRAGALLRRTMFELGKRDKTPQPYTVDSAGLLAAALKPTSRYGPWDTIPEADFRLFVDEFLAGGTIPAAADPATANFIAAEMTACHLYDLYGRQVYTLSPLIHEMFDNTDLGALTLADVKMPFPCFYISLQKPRLGIDGFYVYKTTETLSFVAVGFGNGDWIPGAVADPATFERRPCLNEVWPADVIDKMPPGEMDHRGRYYRYFFEIALNDFSREVAVGQIIGKVLEVGGVRGAWMKLKQDGLKHAERQTRMMVMTFFNLLFFLNSDDRSVLTHDDRDEKAEAEAAVAKLSGKRGTRKRGKRRDAKERLKYLSTARFTRVGVQQEQDITSREGFDIDQPRHWRRGHFHRYWTGPLKAGGAKIPFEAWPDKRTIVRQWLIPVLINPEADIEEVTTRTVIKGVPRGTGKRGVDRGRGDRDPRAEQTGTPWKRVPKGVLGVPRANLPAMQRRWRPLWWCRRLAPRSSPRPSRRRRSRARRGPGDRHGPAMRDMPRLYPQ